MNFPENLRYTKDHEWISLEGNVATIGITDFAQRELGDIVYVDINTVGKALNAEEVFGTVEAVKTVSDLFLPVAGTITEVNSALNDAPEALKNELANLQQAREQYPVQSIASEIAANIPLPGKGLKTARLS